ncbi:NCS2 family permease [Paenibacillus antri]|uniref:NCS2 family permease n=1 Tax=Paenibacillus antri TaxID=2582848 RepID=A0A5R9GKC9_9BACL|nr:NCS2 family permease [Paenibacillus antri]TLS52125.1 NCS2 family permease [Paenibacillus antri]
MDRLFQLKARGTNVRTELIAGLTTFMTMAYILFVNQIFLGPSGAGMPAEAVFFATALGAGLVTIAMGLFVNIPVALAPGMGLNAYFMSVVLSSNGEITWQTALGAVFISGIIFIILTVTKVRQMLVTAVPNSIKVGITVGIGLFIAIIGFKLSNIVAISVNPGVDATVPVPGSGFNLMLGSFNPATHPDTFLALLGLIIIGILMALKVRGALLIGIVATTIIGGLPFLGLNVVDFGALGTANWIPSFDNLAVGQLDIGAALGVGLLEIIFVFTFVELFDTFGTLVGTVSKAGIDVNQPEGKKTIGKAMMVDAAGVSTGALLGTSTITAYIESASGVSEGGRTGLTSVTTGILFILALLILPLAGIVPSAATAPALIIVGVLMMSSVKEIQWDDFTQAFPAFLTIVFMPFTGSIANGISAGIVTYVVVAGFCNLFSLKKAPIHWMMWLLAALVVARFAFFGGE